MSAIEDALGHLEEAIALGMQQCTPSFWAFDSEDEQRCREILEQTQAEIERIRAVDLPRIAAGQMSAAQVAQRLEHFLTNVQSIVDETANGSAIAVSLAATRESLKDAKAIGATVGAAVKSATSPVGLTAIAVAAVAFVVWQVTK